MRLRKGKVYCTLTARENDRLGAHPSFAEPKFDNRLDYMYRAHPGQAFNGKLRICSGKLQKRCPTGPGTERFALPGIPLEAHTTLLT